MKLSRIMFVCCCVLSLALCLCGCGKESSPAGEEVPPVGDPVEINIASDGLVVTGVEDLGGTRAVDADNRVTFTESLNDEYDLEVTIAPSAEEVPVATRAPVPVNGTMRIVVCDAGGNIVSQCAYDMVDGYATEQSGQKLTVPYSTTPYTFHCFTPGNALDLSTKKVVINETDNFNYASKQITIDSPTGSQEITTPLMLPMMSKLKYSGYSDDYPGEFTCKGTIKGVFGSSATWTLGSSSLTTTGTAGKVISFRANNEEKLILSGVSTGTLSMTISDLVIGGTSYGSPTLTSVPGITLLPGKIYTVTVKIRGSYIMVGGVKWAKGNLRYLGGGKYAQAKLPNDPTATVHEVRGDFFRWCYTLPQSASNTSSDYPNVTWTVTTPNWNGDSDLGNYSYYKGIIGDTYTKAPSSNPISTETGDPCKGLGSKWRMPTYNELMLLAYTPGGTALSGSTALTTARNHLKNGILSSGNDGNSWNDTSTDAAKKQRGVYITKSGLRENPAAPGSYSAYNASQHLFLPAAGNSAGGSVNSSGSLGNYWSSTPYSGSSIGSWYVYFFSGNFNLGTYSRIYGFPVRCVLE